jgi:hypothetical protein
MGFWRSSEFVDFALPRSTATKRDHNIDITLETPMRTMIVSEFVTLERAQEIRRIEDDGETDRT